jgi:hypothetical protein
MAGRTAAAGRRARPLSTASSTWPATRANGFAARAAEPARGCRLPVLAQQPHRRRRPRSAHLEPPGSRGRARPRRSSSSMPPTRRTSPIPRCPARSTRSPAPKDLRPRAAQLSPSGPGSRACAAPSPSCPRRAHGQVDPGAASQRVAATTLWDAPSHATKFNGSRVCRAARRRGRVLARRARADRRRRSPSTWRTRACLREGLAARPASRCLRRQARALHLARARPAGAPSWEFFDTAPAIEAQVVGTPGAGFGPAGEGYFRLSAFNYARQRRGSHRPHPARLCLMKGSAIAADINGAGPGRDDD